MVLCMVKGSSNTKSLEEEFLIFNFLEVIEQGLINARLGRLAEK